MIPMGIIAAQRDALGPELIVNGGFDVDANWFKGSGWSISGGVAVGSSATNVLRQTVGTQPAGTYRLTYTIASRTAGGLQPSLGFAVASIRTGVGTYTEDIVADSFSTLALANITGNFSGTVDNISLRRVS